MHHAGLACSSDFGPDRPIVVPRPPFSFSTVSRSNTWRTYSVRGSDKLYNLGRSSSGLRSLPAG